jgi:hypothetical protein
MHDGGSKLILYLNDYQVCSSNATYGGDGATTAVGGKNWETISKMTGRNDPIKVKKGDYIKIESQYYFELHLVKLTLRS